MAILTGPDTVVLATFELKILPLQPHHGSRFLCHRSKTEPPTPTKVALQDAVNGVFGVDGKVTTTNGLTVGSARKLWKITTW